jgi:putative DNA primase/helicase
LEFGYDPKAKAPRFEQFLREVWPDDDEARQSLLEMFGLCFTDITKYHQAFMLVGPPRGGRGTIGRVLHGLIGEENYVGTTLKALSEPFGLESFIGKKVVAFPDARLEGVHPRNLSTLAERLLTITGGDDMHVNRKNAKYWEGKLTARIVLFSNELLRMQDQSGALASRFVVSQMRERLLWAGGLRPDAQATCRTPWHFKSGARSLGSSTHATTTTGSASVQERPGHVAGPC